MGRAVSSATGFNIVVDISIDTIEFRTSHAGSVSDLDFGGQGRWLSLIQVISRDPNFRWDIDAMSQLPEDQQFVVGRCLNGICEAKEPMTTL